jgi:hypothetical protein
MTKVISVIICVVALCITTAAEAKTLRSQTQKRHFAKANPCPLTGARTVSCKGYVIDHIVALCKGGVDHSNNMQWQTVVDAKIKDKTECKK